ncbi:MAG: aminotransferase class V-fold PLP-dependent enzyme [Candidatus Bipolaricaulia bacterium]
MSSKIQSLAEADWSQLRSEFPILNKKTYLNTCSLGALSQHVIAEIAHRHGAYLFIDDYQATGQVPIDVKESDVDFLVTGGLKWLLGGPGIVYLYVREDLSELLLPNLAYAAVW